MSAKNKKLLAVLGAAAVVVIVIAAVLLGKGGQTQPLIRHHPLGCICRGCG